MRRRLFVTALVAAMTASIAPAFAGVALNTIDRKAIMDTDHRVVEVTGPLRCTRTERATIRVTVSQRTTGAVAEGRWRGLCRPTTRTWTARSVTAHASPSFRTGTAKACALGVTRQGRTVTDAKQWCKRIQLVKR
jgi:hypothetical protein